MTKAAAIQATFADYKRVRGRKIGQLVFEIPLEKLHEAIASLGGEPSVNQETWCAIARLNAAANGNDPKIPEAEEEKQRKTWNQLTPTAQACIRCQEPIFQRYVLEVLNYTEGDHEDPEKNAATYIRTKCKVNTRSALTTNPWAGSMWMQIDRDFLDWKVAERMLG